MIAGRRRSVNTAAAVVRCSRLDPARGGRAWQCMREGRGHGRSLPGISVTRHRSPARGAAFSPMARPTGFARWRCPRAAACCFTVLPGRGMDIAHASYRGKTLSFISGTGITSPAYYEEPGSAWLRTFYAGLLTTCGITNCGVPSVDQGVAFGQHGRVANAAAEDLCVEQDWQGDEYEIRVAGTLRETTAMAENMGLRRSIETRLGAKGFRLRDTITNRGFEPQPLMMLYHFNYGFPLLSASSRVVGPITGTQPRDEEARKDRGVEECLRFPEPVQGYSEKVFFHTLAADSRRTHLHRARQQGLRGRDPPRDRGPLEREGASLPHAVEDAPRGLLRGGARAGHGDPCRPRPPAPGRALPHAGRAAVVQHHDRFRGAGQRWRRSTAWRRKPCPAAMSGWKRRRDREHGLDHPVHLVACHRRVQGQADACPRSTRIAAGNSSGRSPYVSR